MGKDQPANQVGQWLYGLLRSFLGVRAKDDPLRTASVGRKIGAYFEKRSRILLYACSLFTIGGLLSRFGLVFEWMACFRAQYLIVLLLWCLWLAFGRKWRLFVLALCCCLINTCYILPWYVENTPDTQSAEPGIRLLLSNVHTANREYNALIDLVSREDPDVIILQEVNQDWIEAVQVWDTKYPHLQKVPRADNFGIAIFSKEPYTASTVLRLGQADVPTISVTLMLQGRKIEVIGTHPLPPSGTHYFRMRNQQLSLLADYVRSVSHDCIVIGDLNVTMWAHQYESFVKVAQLSSARKGYGVCPTWPTMLPFLYIPIEHCLYKGSLQVTDFRTGPGIGSDHLPLIVDVGRASI